MLSAQAWRKLVDAFAFCKSTVAISLLAASIGALAQQPEPLTEFDVQGHVYEAPTIPPNDERIARLSFPFRKAP
jgi:hypothetical protein